MTDIIYKVLWVDDDESIVKSTKLDAEEYNLELVHFTNWEEAEKSLTTHFKDYSAVILDANCKIHKDSVEEEEFITAILPSLSRIYTAREQYIPWYILSAGTMSNFESVIRGAKYQHSEHEDEWGKMLYLKDAVDDSEQSSSRLFENIQRVAKDKSTNIVLFRHSDVFKYLGESRLIDNRAREHMLKMLATLYYPEEDRKFQYAGNPLRQIIEYVFRAARKKGLLAEECFDKNGHIILLDACRYMSGLTINCYEGRTIKYQTRWGCPGPYKDGGGGDSIFPPDIAMIVKNTLNYSSSDSHTDEETPFFIDKENKELFFSYVMQIAHLIKWFGKYVEQHPNISENKSKQKRIESSLNETNKTQDSSIDKKHIEKKDIIGKRYLILSTNGVPACGPHKLSEELKGATGQVTILELIDNTGDDRDKFPYIVTKIQK